jgi:hypothetical protein
MPNGTSSPTLPGPGLPTLSCRAGLVRSTAPRLRLVQPQVLRRLNASGRACSSISPTLFPRLSSAMADSLPAASARSARGGGQLNLVRLAGLPCARLARSKRHARTEPALRCSGYDSRNDLDLRRSQISAWRAVGRTPSFRVQATLVTAWQGDLWGSVPECVSHAQNQGHRPSAALPPWLQCPVPQRVKVGELRKQMPPLRRSESPAGAAPQLRTASPAL